MTAISATGEASSWTHDLPDQAFTPGRAVGSALTVGSPDLGESATIVVGVIDFQDGDLYSTPTSDWASNLGINFLASLSSRHVGPRAPILVLMSMGLLAFGASRSGIESHLSESVQLASKKGDSASLW
ncbi:MAG: hypothetical protein P8166_04670 [Candidatus Thiodiazotropha sp.]